MIYLIILQFKLYFLTGTKKIENSRIRYGIFNQIHRLLHIVDQSIILYRTAKKYLFPYFLKVMGMSQRSK